MKKNNLPIRALGFLTLIITLVVFVFTVLNSQASPAPELSGNQAYPPPENPTQPRILQGNSIPYPPPVQPTASPIPKGMEVPTLSVPTVTLSIPTPAPATLPIVGGDMPTGMKFIYGETDGATGTTTIWLASVTLDAWKQLITLTHKVGYSIEGAVSPDGSKVAYLTIPAEASELEARTHGGELWVMEANGTNAHLVASQVGHFAGWSPDSIHIAYSRLVALERPDEPEVPFQTEIYSIKANGNEQSLLLSDATSYGIYPLGWSPEGQAFYYAKVPLHGQWEIWKTSIANGVTELQMQLPYSIIQSFHLSPDGLNLVVTAIDPDSGQYKLTNFTIDGQQQEVIASGAKGDEPPNQYIAVWSPDGNELLVRIPLQGLVSVDLTSNQAKSLQGETVDQSEFFIPQSWSPDGKWLVLLQYPSPQSLVYIRNLAEEQNMRVPLMQPSNWITLLGWTTQGK